MNDTYRLYKLKVGFNYSYIIMDQATGKAAIVDPAWDLERITTMLADLGAEVTMILLTHSHYDHVHLVEPLVNRYQPKVYMSSEEIDYYQYHSPHLHSFADEDEIMLGETKIICLLTPGHTAGGSCFLLSAALLTGDTIFVEGCGICDTPGGCPDQMYESVQKIRNRVDSSVCVYPGHSYGKEPGYPLGYLLKNNIYFQIENKEQFIKFRMRKNQKNLFDFK
ncbi:MBL fold metallo-hydrolase [Brevibacillus laterosporus]|uniref:Polyketide biosynthesis protein n=2 Tax=Brevibacillus TaxID=55080 RepID=A0A0F7EJ74_BRELA|nr:MULTISPECIES: MBL fold metallo-hydrolase [Brevibacillus]AKF95767.1 polyketide biosynthesis protein [Brevibacillus laterosporus]MCR8985514.1 MBL fold metallo-hydrolase [Brevibacillus laterosporus]MCZ0831248.1 MBL fold metallo-hydrolase [Brevibacillus halotolerans]